MTPHSILWRRVDRPGHEAARLARQPPHRLLGGTAVFAHDGQPCMLSYTVLCDEAWQTRSAKVAGWIGERVVDIELTADLSRRWWMNGVEHPELTGCIDVDLGFSPSTNTLPIRRLNLAVGAEAVVHAAWLAFPALTLRPLDQVYRRTGDRRYYYESAGGSFSAEIEVNEAGLVTNYPGLWRAER